MTAERTNSVFIATSLDGCIADRNHSIDFLTSSSITDPQEVNETEEDATKNSDTDDEDDMGFTEFMSRMDALVMGRTTFDTVCQFGLEQWPYHKPVFVASTTLTEIPTPFQDKAQLISGDVPAMLTQLHEKGYNRLYIDGGRLIQSFLQYDLIDELILSTIPIVLGGGIPLFGALKQPLKFQ